MNVRIALVGTGAMAEYHVRKFSAIPGVSIPACADHRSSRAEAFAAKYGIPLRYDRIDALLDAADRRAGPEDSGPGPGIDAISCAVVDSHHPRIAIACLKRGHPLFCEKPMARSLAEAATMAAAAESAGTARESSCGHSPLPVVINFSKRNAPALVALAELVRGGRLGRIEEIDASYLQGWLVTGAWGDWRSSTTRRWRLSPTESTAGVLGDLGSHLVDAILAVTGGKIVDPVLEDSLAFTEAYARGMLGPAHESDADDPLLGPRNILPGQWNISPERQDRSEGSPCPALVEFSAQATLSGGGTARIRASCVDPDSVDAFSVAVRGELGMASLDLRRSRTAVRLETERGEEWVEGARLPSTYEAFIALVQERSAGGPGRPAGVDLPAWMRSWSAPSFREGLEVQRLFESLMDQARARHGGAHE